METIKNIETGTKIKTCLDGNELEEEGWFTGTIIKKEIIYSGLLIENINFWINRDDKETGIGENGSWWINVTNDNKNCIALILGKNKQWELKENLIVK